MLYLNYVIDFIYFSIERRQKEIEVLREEVLNKAQLRRQRLEQGFHLHDFKVVSQEV